jgi:hypothetical protein
LACCVPHLNFDWLLVNLQCLDFKVQTYRTLVLLTEALVGEPNQQTCLAAGAGTDQNNLEEIELLRFGGFKLAQGNRGQRRAFCAPCANSAKLSVGVDQRISLVDIS